MWTFVKTTWFFKKTVDSKWVISEWNEWSLNFTIHFLRGIGGSHNVDIMLGGMVTEWWCLITKVGGGGGGGVGVKNLG